MSDEKTYEVNIDYKWEDEESTKTIEKIIDECDYTELTGLLINLRYNLEEKNKSIVNFNVSYPIEIKKLMDIIEKKMNK